MASLFERLGGQDQLVALVYGVYDMMKQDPELGKFFARHNLTRLKDRTVDYLGGEWGGDKYRGSNLFMSHSHLGVTMHHYDVMMRCYITMFKKLKTDKDLVKELLVSLEAMRDPTCDPTGKHRKAYMKDIAGDPFDEKTWRKAAEERIQKEKAFREKLAAARKARLENERLEREAAEKKQKEIAKRKEQKEKEKKEQKESNDHKEHKDPKDHKDHKDQKDQKDHKDQKDQKVQKDQKDQQTKQTEQKQEEQPVESSKQAKVPSKLAPKKGVKPLKHPSPFCFKPSVDAPPEQIKRTLDAACLGFSASMLSDHMGTK